MFKQMTDAEILSYLEKILEQDIEFSKKSINEWLDFKKNRLLKNIHSMDLEKFSNTLEHLRECERGLRYHGVRIELEKKYLNIIKDLRKDDPYYITTKDEKEICEKCDRFFSDRLTHTICQNLESRHKCRIYFDDEGNRREEKIKKNLGE